MKERFCENTFPNLPRYLFHHDEKGKKKSHGSHALITKNWAKGNNAVKEKHSLLPFGGNAEQSVHNMIATTPQYQYTWSISLKVRKKPELILKVNNHIIIHIKDGQTTSLG